MFGVIGALVGTFAAAAILALLGSLFIRRARLRAAIGAALIPIVLLLLTMLIGAPLDPDSLGFVAFIGLVGLIPAFLGSLLGTALGAVLQMLVMQLGPRRN